MFWMSRSFNIDQWVGRSFKLNVGPVPKRAYLENAASIIRDDLRSRPSWDQFARVLSAMSSEKLDKHIVV